MIRTNGVEYKSSRTYINERIRPARKSLELILSMLCEHYHSLMKHKIEVNLDWMDFYGSDVMEDFVVNEEDKHCFETNQTRD